MNQWYVFTVHWPSKGGSWPHFSVLLTPTWESGATPVSSSFHPGGPWDHSLLPAALREGQPGWAGQLCCGRWSLSPVSSVVSGHQERGDRSAHQPPPPPIQHCWCSRGLAPRSPSLRLPWFLLPFPSQCWCPGGSTLGGPQSCPRILGGNTA